MTDVIKGLVVDVPIGAGYAIACRHMHGDQPNGDWFMEPPIFISIHTAKRAAMEYGPLNGYLECRIIEIQGLPA